MSAAKRAAAILRNNDDPVFCIRGVNAGVVCVVFLFVRYLNPTNPLSFSIILCSYKKRSEALLLPQICSENRSDPSHDYSKQNSLT
jgi:hypothetical protein